VNLNMTLTITVTVTVGLPLTVALARQLRRHFRGPRANRQRTTLLLYVRSDKHDGERP
jgi:hypothetical protein